MVAGPGSGLAPIDQRLSVLEFVVTLSQRDGRSGSFLPWVFTSNVKDGASHLVLSDKKMIHWHTHFIVQSCRLEFHDISKWTGKRILAIELPES